MSTHIIGYGLALVTAACWAQNSVFYAIAGKRVTSHTVTHVRLWFAFPALVLIHFFVLKSFLPHVDKAADFWFLAVSGITGFFITDICIFKAFVDLGPREGMVLMSLAPIFTVIFAWTFLNEHLTGLQLLGILITIAGVVWVILEEGRKGKGRAHLVSGTIAGLTGALMQALSMVLAKKGMPITTFERAVSGNLIRVAFGMAGLIVFALIRRQFIADFRKMKDRKALLLIGTAAMVGPVAGMIAGLYAVAAAEAGVVTTLMQITPVLLLPVDIFFFKKKLTRGAVIATLMAVAGTALLFLVKSL